jgi:16S rRNA processing protein RimM
MASRSSTTDAPIPTPVIVGEIRRPHGVRGEVVVEPQTELPDRFRPGSELWVTRPGRSTPLRTVRVAASRPYRDHLLVRFEGMEDRDAVEELRGTRLEAEPVERGDLEEGTFFYYQLQGCRCRDREHGELGEVVDLVEDGGGLLLIVEGERGRLPVPFVRALIAEVDVEGKRIELELPPGLIEACTSRS